MRTLLFSTLTLFLMTSAGAKPPAKTQLSGATNPCTEIRKACEAAGYKRGGYEPRKNLRKGLYRDCIRPILKGESVKGVRVDSKRVAACRERKKKD